MNYLIIVAHPDDEVLGAGATISKMTKEGHKVDIAIMCAEARARANRPEDDQLTADMESSSEILGIGKTYLGTFPNIEMNTVPHLRLVQFVENAIIDSKPDVVVTHHPSDTNNDHHQTSIACQAAIRLFQRRNDVKPISEFWFMEVPSSTEWSVDSTTNRFQPNTFIEVGKEGVDAKIEALRMYRGVIRNYPHPRSVEGLTGLATYRGVQAGCNYTEAFESVFRRIT